MNDYEIIDDVVIINNEIEYYEVNDTLSLFPIKNSSKICLIEKECFLNEMYKLFRNEHDLDRQFRVDFDRSNFISNYYVYGENGNDIQNVLKYYGHDNLIKITKIMCTQAVFGYIYEKIVFELFEKKPDLYLGEQSKDINNDKRVKIKLFCDKNNVNLMIKKPLRLFKVSDNNDETIYNVYIKIEIDLLTENFVSIYLDIC